MAILNARNVLRRLAVSTAAILTIFMVTTQALAVLPVDWLSWILHVEVFDEIVLRLGSLRDRLGVWNLLIGAASTALALSVVPTAKPGRRGEKILAIASLLGLTTAIATSAVLVSSVVRLGVPVFPLLPTVPLSVIGGHPDKTVVFGRPAGMELRADLYLPAGSSGKLHPVVVNIHGGGFALGARGSNAYTRFLADHGYVVMDIDYRLATKQFHTWMTAVADVGCALTWIETHAKEFDFDTARVATFGESAGGTLAINAAYRANSGTLEPACGAAADMPNVRAAIGGYPAVDLTRGTPASAIGRQVGRYYVGGPSEQYPDIYAQVDSATHVDAKSPPTLIFQGSRDHLVIARQVRDFADLLTARGVVNRYVEYPGLDHGCGDSGGALTYATAASRLLILQWLETYLGRT